MTSIIILLVVFMLFVLTLITEFRIERKNDEYRCYLKQEYRGYASHWKCKGTGKECKGCTYLKNYKLEGKE